MMSGQADADRGGRADLSQLEGAVIDLVRRHGRAVARAAAGGDVDQVERAQRGDDGQRQRDGDLAAHRGQGHREELAHRPGAVQPRGLVQLTGDPAHPGQEQHGDQARLEPRADEPDRRQREGVVAEPAAGQRPQADRGQQRVERAVGGVDPPPGHGDHDHRHDLRQEHDGAEEAQPADLGPVEDRGERQADDQGHHGVEDHEHQRVPERRPQPRVAHDVGVVAQPHPRAEGQAVPAVEGELDRAGQGVEQERGVDQERRQQVEVGDPARLTGRAAAPLARRLPCLLDGPGGRVLQGHCGA